MAEEGRTADQRTAAMVAYDWELEQNEEEMDRIADRLRAALTDEECTSSAGAAR